MIIMNKTLYLILILVLMSGCVGQTNHSETKKGNDTVASSESPQEVDYKRVGDIPLPSLKNLTRDSVAPGSFAEYLRNLPLKPANYPTHLYNGEEKSNERSTYRVVDMDIDSVDLQQCADACIRLYAEYLWHSKQYSKIKFHFVNGFLAEYERWAHGERIKVDVAHRKTSWYRLNNAEDYSYKTFRKYLLMVFNYAGTASLPKDMEETKHYDFDRQQTILPINIGDVIIQPGSPGHAVIVVDKAGELLILAQSYMPAQEIEILTGYYPDKPWSTFLWTNGSDEIRLKTPEWNFLIDNKKVKIMHFK